MNASETGTDATATSMVVTTSATSETGDSGDSGDSGTATDATSSPTTTSVTVTTTDATTTATASTTDPGTTTDTPGTCGDGIVDDGEQCDLGALNGDQQACTSMCLLNVCGDGLTGPGEQCDGGGESAACDLDCSLAMCGDGTVNMSAGETCDDQNDVDTDDCVTCNTATCGDGHIHAGQELCDDGNGSNDDACDNLCQPVSLRVFVSSTTFTGNLNGLTGADKKCNTLAASAGVGGTWMAWLSDKSGPAERFTTKSGARPYVLLNGKVIANSWADLTDGNLATAINITEQGDVAAGSSAVWTNTHASGSSIGPDHCGMWSFAFSDGSNGLRTETSSKWSDEATDQCTAMNHIYCFEQ